MKDTDLIPRSLRQQFQDLPDEQRRAIDIRSMSLDQLLTGSPEREHPEVIANLGREALQLEHQRNEAIDVAIRQDQELTATAKRDRLAAAEAAAKARVSATFERFAAAIRHLDETAAASIEEWHRKGVQEPSREQGLVAQVDGAMQAGRLDELLRSHAQSDDSTRSALLRIGASKVTVAFQGGQTWQAKRAQVALDDFASYARPAEVLEAEMVRKEVPGALQLLATETVPGVIRR